MTPELAMFLLQAAEGCILLFLGFILNGMRTSIKEVNTDLKVLNNSVLGQYITRTDSDAVWNVHRSETDGKWQAQRTLDHELRSIMQTVMVDLAQIKGVPYNYQRPVPPGVTD